MHPSCTSICVIQLVAHFVMSVFGDYPGIPGCFIAAIFAAALRYDVI